MQLAFVLYKYFPFGGLQRDFMRIALECQQRGHQIRVYTLIWEGDVPPGFEVLVAPVKAIFNHRRNEKLLAWMQADLARRPVDRVEGRTRPLLPQRAHALAARPGRLQAPRGGAQPADRGAARAHLVQLSEYRVERGCQPGSVR